MAISTITVAGIKPDLNILGNTQNFNFTVNDTFFGISTTFVPIEGIASRMAWQFKNANLAGFRFTHITTNTDTVGIFKFQTFVDGSSEATDILTLSTTGVTFNKPAAFPEPVLDTDAANKAYVDRQRMVVGIGSDSERPPDPASGTLYYNTGGT